MEKYKVSSIAEILGVAQKTVYRMIDRGEVKTCLERVNNRETTLIMLSNNELNELIEKYKNQGSQGSQARVNDVDDFNNVNILSGQKVANEPNQADYVEKLHSFVLEVNDRHSHEVREYVDRLVTSQSQALYLEDKQKGQEALYLNEINNLTRSKNTLIKLSIGALIVMTVLLVSVLWLYIAKLNNPTIVEKTIIKEVPKIVTVKAPIKVRKR